MAFRFVWFIHRSEKTRPYVPYGISLRMVPPAESQIFRFCFLTVGCNAVSFFYKIVDLKCVLIIMMTMMTTIIITTTTKQQQLLTT